MEQADGLRLTWFTDPLCCWSWGMQPHLDELQSLYREHMTVEYVMGGLLPSWTHYTDNVNAVSRPAQMGPVWMHAAQLTHRPVAHQLWIKDPPASSYPACVAVCCARLQSTEASMRLFRKLQEAAMQEMKNISEKKVLLNSALHVSKQWKAFDYDRFRQDLLSERGADAFKEDLSRVAAQGITRFPSLVIQAAGEKGILITGYRTLQSLQAAIAQAFPSFAEEPSI